MYCMLFSDAVYSQLDLAKQIFHEGVERGFYAKVSRLGTQWLELDLHFLSLGGGETALRWWFEECLVPYLGSSKELASVKSIDIVTGYGKTRSRGARKGDDGMRKRVRAMLSFMNLTEVEQPNLGRIHINKEALTKEVERNGGRIIFDAQGYEQYKLREGLDDPHKDAEQFVRPRGGAMHARNERDVQDQWGPSNEGNAFSRDQGGFQEGRPDGPPPRYNGRNYRPDNHNDNVGHVRNGGGGYREEYNGRQGYGNPPERVASQEPLQPFHQNRNGGDDWQGSDRGVPPRRYENQGGEYNNNHDRNWHDNGGGNNYRNEGNRNEGNRNSSYNDSRQHFHSPRYNERKRSYDGPTDRYNDRGGQGEYGDFHNKRPYQR